MATLAVVAPAAASAANAPNGGGVPGSILNGGGVPGSKLNGGGVPGVAKKLAPNAVRPNPTGSCTYPLGAPCQPH